MFARRVVHDKDVDAVEPEALQTAVERRFDRRADVGKALREDLDHRPDVRPHLEGGERFAEIRLGRAASERG